MDLKQAIMLILDQAHGKDQKIKRASLRLRICSLLGQRISDRRIRDAIADLREHDPRGAYICATTYDGGGYWIAGNLEELREHLDTERRRSMSILSCIHQQALRAGIKLSGQMDLSI